MSLFAGFLFILLALVHLVFAGQKLQLYELPHDLAWHEGSWLFSQLFNDPAVRWLAAVSLVLASLSFLAAGLGLFLGAGWWQNATLSATGISVVIHLLFRDGNFHIFPDQGGAGFSLSLGILLLALALCSGPAALRSDTSINRLEQVELGGVKQWVSIRGVDRRAPVLLFLHGGPGSANIAKLRIQVPELEEHFVVVNWDQRGAGKSASPGFDSSALSRQQLLSDAHELVGLLKDRFGVQRIYLMGFSWGTVLGLSLAEQYPDDFEAFISVSQVVNYQTGEQVSLAYAREAAQRAGDSHAVADLAGVDPAYTSPDWQKQLSTQRKWLLQFGGVYHTSRSYSHEIGMMLKAPEYSFIEVALWPMSSSNAIKGIWPELMHLNFLETVPAVGCPVYFFVGRHDYNSPWKLTETYYQAVNAPAGKQLVWFDNSAHDLFFDEPRRLEQEVLAVLETHNQP